MSLVEDNIKRNMVPLVAFKGSISRSLGTIELSIKAHPLNHLVEFHVIQCSSPYNVIMERPWIHKTKGVLSTYHQVLRYPSNKGVMKIKGDQRVSRSYTISHLRATKKEMLLAKASPKLVSIPIDNLLIVRLEVEEKAVEKEISP